MDPSHAQFVASGEKYFDPDAPDESEQQFSASLEAAASPVSFVVDSAEEQSATDGEEQSPSPSLPVVEAEPVSEKSRASSDTPSPLFQDWRQQVTAKVRSYHSRRNPKERYPSLRLPFDALRWTDVKASPAPARSHAASLPEASRAEPVPERCAGGRLLEFPRPPAPTPTLSLRDELAEAVERPRILEVPEIAPPPPAMGGILIEPEEELEPEPMPGIDRPLEPASLKRRLAAGFVDFLVVVAALVGFFYIFLRLNPSLPDWRVEAKMGLGLVAFFWPVYQYLFLVFSGSTPGLRIFRLEVKGFDGLPVARKRRRRRALAALLSSAFLGIGYLWCLFDEDRLSWHDRVTRTHLAPRSPAA